MGFMPPASAGISHWLSELGMEDPVLVRQLESLHNPTAEQLAELLNSTDCGYNCGIPEFGSFATNEVLSYYEPPLKMIKRSPQNELQGFCSQAYGHHNHQASYGKAILPEAPTTPTLQQEMGGSPVSVLSDKSSPNQVEYKTSKNSNYFSMDVNSTRNPSYLQQSAAKPPGHTQDHIMAERKRREKLSQRFIALSAIVPGLKKTDKASVLGDAIKYVKQLQEKLKAMEEHSKQSVAYSSDSPNGKSSGKRELMLHPPEIEARMLGRNVLIRVHCEKRKGLLVKLTTELERIKMQVVNASAISFSDTALDLTFSAQMEEDCMLTVEELVRDMRAFMKAMD